LCAGQTCERAGVLHAPGAFSIHEPTGLIMTTLLGIVLWRTGMRSDNLLCMAALGAALLAVGCGESSNSGTSTVSMGGIAWGFTLPDPSGGGYDRIADATVSVLERPELQTITDDQGEFTIAGIPSGSDATFVMEHPNYPLAHSKTHIVPATDVTDLTFQVPNRELYSLIELGLGITTDPEKCQMVSTFTRYGKTIGDPGPHGQAGAVLGIESPADATIAEGPIYFNDDVLPDPTRSYSSLDGGVLILNADPGDYTLSASCVSDPDLMAAFVDEYPEEEYPDEDLRCQTEDVEFESVRMKCRSGVFVNASPSYGLQALPPAE
jgi:hypothetical protein